MEWKKDIEENVRSGIVELLILQLLSEQDMYGYEKMLAQRTNDAFEIKKDLFTSSFTKCRQADLDKV